jgi:hypothetical protein
MPLAGRALVRPVHTKEVAMKSKYLWVLLSATALMLGTHSVLAASAAVKEMAGIMMHLNHYPDDAEKARLKAIAADMGNTEQERVIATAISNLEHKVAAADADKLRQVTGDMSAPAEVRDLAGIVLGINHKPGKEEKKRLEMMSK